MRTRLSLGCSLLLGLALIGCQSPAPAPAPTEQASTAQPKVIVNYGRLEISQEADLAIAVNFKQKKYGVQAATMRADIQSVRVTVSGPNLAAPLVETITRAQFSQGLAVFNFTNLPPGPVNVLVEALDLSGNVITSASGSAEIIKGQIAQLTLDCELTTGDLVVVFRCDDCVPVSSPMPTPVATATPTPTPTPSSVEPSGSPGPGATPTPTPAPTTGNFNVSLEWVDSNSYKVKSDSVADYSVDPYRDGHFRLSADRSGEITRIDLHNPANTGSWTTIAGPYAFLGVFLNDSPIYTTFTPSNQNFGVYTANTVFDVYGMSEVPGFSDFIGSGHTIRATVVFSDGYSSFTEVVIP